MKQVAVCEPALDPVRRVAALPQGLPKLQESWEPFALQAVDGTSSTINSQMILLVGRMGAKQRHKGQDTLIQSFEAILDSHPQAQLVIGGSGDDFPRLYSLARSLPARCQGNIFMPGDLTEDMLERLFQQCFVFAMPSRGEGFGIVYLEAMRWAKPCVGSKVDAASCVIKDGKTGVLVNNPASPAEVADKLSWLLANPMMAIEMGREGYREVQQSYLIESFETRFWKIIKSGKDFFQ
jgi:phosphatidylinositol alpha-1,6-mannosyltransferase